MSDSIRVDVIDLVITRLNDGTVKPAGLPSVQRDAWVDIETGPDSFPAAFLIGFEDVPDPGADSTRGIDPRILTLTFVLFARSEGGKAAHQWLDEMEQWIKSRLCGFVERGSAFARLATQIRIGKVVMAVGQGDVCRSLVQVVVEYRTLASDATRWQ